MERGGSVEVAHAGALHRAPLGPLAMLRTRLLSPRAKLALLREPWVPRNESGVKESVAEFVRRRFGPEVHDRLVAPLLSGIYAGDTARLGTAAVFPSLVEMEARHGSVTRGAIFGSRDAPAARRQILSLRGGLAALAADEVSRFLRAA